MENTSPTTSATQLTDHEVKVLKYIEQRKTPASIKEVALQALLSRQAAHRVLTQLVRKRQIRSYLEFIAAKKPERRYVSIHSEIAATLPPPKIRRKPKINNFYNDPFNLLGVRDAN